MCFASASFLGLFLLLLLQAVITCHLDFFCICGIFKILCMRRFAQD